MKNFAKTIGMIGLFLCVDLRALTTAYASFEHPDGWRCELSQGVWICQSAKEPERRESVVLSIATMRTEWDSLENYLNYLKRPRTIEDEAGNKLTSKVTYARKRVINGVTWIDSLQYNSEMPGFWARYVATVRDKLAILITYIVSDEYYSKLAPRFERMVNSLKPNEDFDLSVRSEQGTSAEPINSKLGPQDRLDLLKNRLRVAKNPGAEPKSNPDFTVEDGSNNWLLYVIGGGALVLYVALRRRRKRKKEKDRKEPNIQQAS